MKNGPKKTDLLFAVLAADVALFTMKDNRLLVRLVKIDRPPQFKNSKGLPGGLIDPSETARESAERHLKTKARIDTTYVYLEQLYTFSNIDRDPRGRVVAVAYLGLIPWENLSTQEQTDTPESWWSDIHTSSHMAYDHDEILAVAIDRLRSKAAYSTLLSKLMPAEFTLTELESAYETMLHIDLDKRNFRKKILKLKILKTLPHKRTGLKSRPAQLYAFSSQKVIEIGLV